MGKQFVLGILMIFVGLVIYLWLPTAFGTTFDWGDGIVTVNPAQEWGILGLVILLLGLGIAKTAN